VTKRYSAGANGNSGTLEKRVPRLMASSFKRDTIFACQLLNGYALHNERQTKPCG
jgi:hypothetical protein